MPWLVDSSNAAPVPLLAARGKRRNQHRTRSAGIRHTDYRKSLNLFDGFYAGEGHRTPIPNSFFDHVISKEPLAVVKVVGTVLRHTVGYQNQFGGRRTSAPLSYSYIHCTQTGRFHADEAKRKAACYAVKWRVCDSSENTGSETEPADRSKSRTSTGSKTEPKKRHIQNTLTNKRLLLRRTISLSTACWQKALITQRQPHY